MRLSAHFALSEFSSPTIAGGKISYAVREQPPAEYHAHLVELCAALEVVRADLGGRPISIVSGWRSAAYNRVNKGRASRSLHLFGKAADIRVRGVGARRVYYAILELQRAGQIPRGGLAAYHVGQRREFVHYDIRGVNARWKAAP